MSAAGLMVTLARIKKANHRSPIIVYATPDPDIYDSRFADTVVGKRDMRRWLNDELPSVIGVFDGTQSREEVRAKLIYAPPLEEELE